MKDKVIIFASLLLMITAVGAWAQNLPNNIWSSPQSTTTEGRYRSNADDFIRPDAYTGVKFSKWFGLVSFLHESTNNSAIANVGFATKANDVYIGAFYNGNFWAGAPANNYIEQEPATVPNGGVAGTVYDVYPNISVTPSPVNNAAILIGVANMGFRLTYRTNYQFFNESDIVTGVTQTSPGQLYSNYQSENGYLAPQIAWAMAKDLTQNGIRPYVTVDLVFDRLYQKTETVGPDVPVAPNPVGNTGAKIGRSENHFDPSLSAGLGGYTFYNKDGFKGSFDFDYVLTFKFYDNEYSYVEGNTYKIGNIKGIYTTGNNPYLEQSYLSNLLTPSLSGSWSKDKVALKFKLNLPLTLENQEKNIMNLNASNNLVYDGASTAYTTFIFRPDLRLAMQYKIIPDKLTLNAGARIQATTLTLETVSITNYNMGTKTSTQTQHNKSFSNGGTGTQFVNRFHIGAAFNFSENVWAEATTGVSNAYGDGAIDIFAPGGLFSFGSILVALKF
ncbi:TDE2508 family outer membrane beta-barrel protein [Treponema sp. R80B11-R83G3]